VDLFAGAIDRLDQLEQALAHLDIFGQQVKTRPQRSHIGTCVGLSLAEPIEVARTRRRVPVQVPVNVGARFSAKAVIPSAKSPEPAISLWICASNSSWSLICS
jgi:hypothetical protein